MLDALNEKEFGLHLTPRPNEILESGFMKLSVAIPTHNRRNLLEENLLNLANQIKLLKEPVEVVISDNASTDGTELMVAEMITSGLLIAYHRNPANLGMDENADLAIQRSRGEYVLLLGDDDLLEPDALVTILKCLHVYPDLALIYLNFRIYDGKLENEIDFRDQAFDRIERDDFFADGLQVVEKTRKIFAAISGGVYKRTMWEQANPSRFYGTIFIHVGITLDILCRARAPAYIFKRPLFKYRLNDSAPGHIKSYKDIFAVSFGLLRIIKEHKPYIPSEVFSEMYQRELSWTREKILGAKARERVPVKKTFSEMRQSYDTSRPDFWLVDVPMLLIPKWLLNLPYQAYRLLKYRRSRA